jgi:hypothetical protein
MKRCTRDNLDFPDNHRFCSVCGAMLVEEFEASTLLMPKMKTKQAKFIEMNDDFTVKLSIQNKIYKLSMEEVKTLAAEIYATVEAARR